MAGLLGSGPRRASSHRSGIITRACSQACLARPPGPWSRRPEGANAHGRNSRWDGLGIAERFHIFPYREEERREGPDQTPVSVARPTVDVRLSSGDLEITVRALIDTGAPNTFFDSSVAEALQLNISPLRATRRVRVLGNVFPAEPTTVTLSLPPFDDICWETEVMVLAVELDLPFAGCLGSQGFLDRWVVSFNYYDSYFVVEERNVFVQRMPVYTYVEFQEKFDQDWWPPGTG